MPTYPEYKTYRGGFYHNKNQNGIDDRVYSAEDLRMPYNVMFSDGVKPVGDGTVGDMLKVSATTDMGISVAKGYAQLGGAWFVNDSVYNIMLDYASTADRYDCVIVRNDDTEAVRDALIYVKSLNRVPTVDDLVREGGIYELCLAYVKVSALATSITDSDIVDTRDDGELCNVMSGVGAIATYTFRKTYITEYANQSVIPIRIPQFNRTRDRLTVIIEGRIFNEYAYTIDSNEQITLTSALPVIGTKIDLEVAKNVNASGADGVVTIVADLLKLANDTNEVLECHYRCNGMNDNVILSELAQTFLNNFGAFDGRKMTVYVYGSCGAFSPYSGSGTNTDPYVWFKFGRETSTDRKVVFDFANSSRIYVRTNENTYDTIFYGHDMFLKNAVVRVEQPTTNVVGGVTVVGSKSGRVLLDNCSLTASGAMNNVIAHTGTLNDCYCHVTNTKSHSIALYGYSDSFFVINGGEFYAYATGTYVAACLFVGREITDTKCVVKADKMNCPTNARDGYTQKWAIRDLTMNGFSSYRDTVSALEVLAESQLIEGTAVVSKPNRL